MSCEVSFDVCMGECSQILIRFGGGCRAGCRVRCRFDVCMGECSQILIRFGGGCRAGCRVRCRLMCVWVSARRF